MGRRADKKDLEQFVQDGWPRKILYSPASWQCPRRTSPELTPGDCESHSGHSARAAMARNGEAAAEHIDGSSRSSRENWATSNSERPTGNLPTRFEGSWKRYNNGSRQWSDGSPALCRDMSDDRHFVRLVNGYSAKAGANLAHSTSQTRRWVKQKDWQPSAQRVRLIAFERRLEICGTEPLWRLYRPRGQKEAMPQARLFAAPSVPWPSSPVTWLRRNRLADLHALIWSTSTLSDPAKMEQREGRLDRVGRKLPGPVNVYYLLVAGTYDERMLHQLVVVHAVARGSVGSASRRAYTRKRMAVRMRNGRALQRCGKLTLDLRPRDVRRSPKCFPAKMRLGRGRRCCPKQQLSRVLRGPPIWGHYKP